VVGLAALGKASSASLLLDLLEVPALSRLAADALVTIGGIDLRAGTRRTDEHPNDDPRDERVALDPDADRPWPEPSALRSEWARAEPQLPRDERLLLGRPIGAALLAEVLATGSQRMRAAAALERALAQPGTPLYEVRDPAFRQ
jgi:hypothetical protein